MTEHTRALLRRRLEADPDAAIATLQDGTDTSLAIGADVWRLSWSGQATTAVAADASLATSCGALLDAIALHELGWGPVTDRSGVNVLVHRPAPGPVLSEVDQAMRSLRDAAGGFVRVWYDESARWVEDLCLAPEWAEEDARVGDWVDRLLIPRLTSKPHGLALELLAAVADPSAHLYPSEIRRGASDVWALRIDGLEIGIVTSTLGTFKIGQPSDGVPSDQRAAFLDVFGANEVAVTRLGEPGSISVAGAAVRIAALLERFRGTKVQGAPVAHRGIGGVQFVDEHALEARLLKGPIRLDDATELVCDDREVARGSQFPTLWGHGGPARYLDALLRRGSTPVAVELKVATGGQGRYYRRAITQAVLYRHFIVHASGLEPWFREAGLDRLATEAVVGVPIPDRYTALFDAQLDLLRRIGARLGVAVHVLDGRAAGEWEPEPDLPEPPAHEFDRLTWRLAAAISARWPRSFGRLCDVTDAGGFYNQLCLQATNNRSIDYPSERPRILINRHGSTWVFNQLGQPRWVWRGVREQMARGASADDAAEIIGRIAGVWPPERPDPAAKSSEATFAELAAEFLELVPAGACLWQNAWLDGVVHDWVDRFKKPLRQYARTAPDGTLPTIARI
jgi:hypothetical protein